MKWRESSAGEASYLLDATNQTIKVKEQPEKHIQSYALAWASASVKRL